MKWFLDLGGNIVIYDLKTSYSYRSQVNVTNSLWEGDNIENN